MEKFASENDISEEELNSCQVSTRVLRNSLRKRLDLRRKKNEAKQSF